MMKELTITVSCTANTEADVDEGLELAVEECLTQLKAGYSLFTGVKDDGDEDTNLEWIAVNCKLDVVTINE